MLKKLFSFILCGIILLCFVACGRNTASKTQQTESTNQNESYNQTNTIFDTQNIKRITFYAYYGTGKGSDVPTEHLPEIINWLNSFAIGDKAPDILPPGTNTVHVEIEYSDGSAIKQGMNTTTVNGIAYYIKGDATPDCYEEIISKTRLEPAHN